MNQSTNQPFNPARLAKALSTLRRRKHISLNQLAKLTGLSRRTLARIESGQWSFVTGRGSRTAGRLARVLLGPERFDAALADATRLSRFLGPDPLYKFLDVLYHFPAFLFHDSPMQQALRAEFGSDYEHSLDLLARSGFGTRNLGARLRAFRMQHHLTLIETADLLDLSKSELHRLERAERSPSPRTRYRILRLLTLPSDLFRGLSREALRVGGPLLPLEGHDFSRADTAIVPFPGGKRAASLRGQRAGRVGNANRAGSPLLQGETGRRVEASQRLGRAGNTDTEPVARRASLEESRGNPRRVAPPQVHSRSRVADRGARVAALKALLSLPPPKPGARSSESDPLDALRHLWLAGPLKTKELAAALGVSQPHLIRLLRGDRNPSRRLLEQLGRMTPRLRQSPD